MCLNVAESVSMCVVPSQSRDRELRNRFLRTLFALHLGKFQQEANRCNLFREVEDCLDHPADTMDLLSEFSGGSTWAVVNDPIDVPGVVLDAIAADDAFTSLGLLDIERRRGSWDFEIPSHCLSRKNFLAKVEVRP